MPILTIITLPTGFVGDITDNASGLIGDLSPVITLIMGVLLTGVLITLIIHAIKK